MFCADIYSKQQQHSVWKYFKKSHFINSFVKTLVTLCLVYFDSQNIYGTHIWGQNPVKPGPPMMKFVYTQSLRCCLNCIRATVNDKKSNVRWINRLRKAAGKTRVEQRISNGDSSTRLPSPSSAKKKVHVNFFAIFMSLSCVDKNRYYSGFWGLLMDGDTNVNFALLL